MSDATMSDPENGLQDARPSEIIDVTEKNKAIGRYILIWRKESKQIARVIGFQGAEMSYVMMTGPEKGISYRAEYLAKTIEVYDDDNFLILAAVE
jgi:hypothetical protein